MEIQTYEIEELKSSEATTMACDSEAAALAEQLGLTGQKTLMNPETETRFPYPRLTKSQDLVYRALFPAKSSIRAYADGIIPLRVLQVIAYCKDFPQTAYMEIWHSDSPKEDPILVGRSSEYTSDNYLLARWGDSLPDFETLKAKALPLLKSRFIAEAQKAKTRIENYIVSVDDLIQVQLETGERPSFNVYD